jgi:hypothetical protein
MTQNSSFAVIYATVSERYIFDMFNYAMEVCRKIRLGFRNVNIRYVFLRVCFHVAFGQTFFTFDTNFQMALKNFINILLVSQGERYRAIMTLLSYLIDTYHGNFDIGHG